MTGETDIDRVLRINPNSLDARRNLKSFVEQYGEYALAKEFDPKSTMHYTPFVLCLNASVFGIPELADKPLVLTNSSLRHIRVKHGAQIDVLDGLVEEMRGNLLVFGDAEHNGNLDFLLSGLSEHGNRLVCIVKAVAHANGVTISQVRSVHGKNELDYLLKQSLDRERLIYTNERTGDWLRNPRNMSAEAELSSETRQRLPEIHYTQYGSAPDEFEWRDLGSLSPADLMRSIKALGEIPLDERRAIAFPWRSWPAGTSTESIKKTLLSVCDMDLEELLRSQTPDVRNEPLAHSLVQTIEDKASRDAPDKSFDDLER